MRSSTMFCAAARRAVLRAPPPLARHWRLLGSSFKPVKPVEAKIEAPKKDFDVAARAEALGVAMTETEIRNLKKFARPTGATRLARGDYLAAYVGSSAGGDERAFLAEFIVRSDERSSGQRLLVALDLLGAGLFAVVGAQCAGVAGMNVVGATLVGCVSGLGGLTLNNLLTGSTAGGVFWMRDPRFLVVAVAASVATFYAWPEFEARSAERSFDRLLVAAGAAARRTSVSRDEFAAALADDPALDASIFAAVAPSLEPGVRDACAALPSLRPHLVFEFLNVDGTHWLHEAELRVVARLQATNSPLLFGLESCALGAVAVIGAQAGITAAVSPLACVALGLSSCSGGVARDLLCNRDIAVGSQSYALATSLGASVYVGLRALVVRGWAIPLVARVGLAFAATLAQRGVVFVWAPPLATWPRDPAPAPRATVTR